LIAYNSHLAIIIDRQKGKLIARKKFFENQGGIEK